MPVHESEEAPSLLELWQEPRPSGMRWTAPQKAFEESPLKLTVWWGANGIGKSQKLAGMIEDAIAGKLHWQRKRRAGRTVMAVGNTWKQLGVTMAYFFANVPKGWFKPGVRFEGGSVRGQRLPEYDIIGGPGKGGKLILGIFMAKNLAGPRAEVIISDEPLPEGVHNELWPRLLGRGGRMYVSFTPTLGTAHNLEYLWKLVDNPKIDYIGEIQTPLTMDAVTLRGGLCDYSWMTPYEIEQLEAGLSDREVDMRMGRSRTARLDAAYFSAWGPHLRQDWPVPGNTPIGVSLDHGSKPGAQRASLVAVSGTGFAAHAHVLDHYMSDGRTRTLEDARSILQMLDRNGIELREVDVWVGDRAHHGDKRGGRKSNARLRSAIGELLGLNTSSTGWMEKIPAPLRDIHTPRKYDGSVDEGVEILHRLMVDGRFTVSTRPECNPLDDDFTKWQYSFGDPHKDGIDSVRYTVVPMVEGRKW